MAGRADNVIHWQDFEVIGGAIARNKTEAGEQYEGRLELAGGWIFTFVFDREGANWGWRVEPAFGVTRIESEGDD